jgi:hypothetical protein
LHRSECPLWARSVISRQAVAINGNQARRATAWRWRWTGALTAMIKPEGKHDMGKKKKSKIDKKMKKLKKAMKKAKGTKVDRSDVSLI